MNNLNGESPRGATAKLPDEGASGSRGARVNPWISPARYVLAWLVPALLALYLKIYLMANGKGFRVVARYLGRVERRGFTGLTQVERISFFRSEIFFLFILIPLALLLLYRLLPRALRVLFSLASGVCLSVALFIQLRALEEVGRYISAKLIWTAALWGWHDPAANSSYLLTRELFFTLAGILFIHGIVWWSYRRDRADLLRPGEERRWRFAGAFYFSAMAILFAISLMPRLPWTPYRNNSMRSAISALWRESKVDTTEFADLSPALLIQRYREMTNAPAPQRDLRYWDKAQGCNVILFLLETTPARFLPADDSLDEFPNLRRLREHSFIATQHFTTFPHTNRALFSLFSSWYPSDGIQTLSEQHPDAVTPGMMRALLARGYQTAFYAPYRLFGDADLKTFGAMGFEKQVFADPKALAPYWPRDLQPAWKADRIARDLAALNLMKQDIDRWLIDGKQFAAVYAPQAGHIPWPDAVPPAEEKNLLKRGRAIVALQDAWLGQLLDLLERHQQLGNTIIIVTGDHGVRTLQEDPGLVGGMIDERSFEVPFLIYVPKALDHTEKIPWVTSHIDVAPAVLDLLGIEQGRDSEQGTSLWNPELAGRTTYLFALQALGADGYYSHGEYFMWNQLFDAVYSSPRPHFEPSNILPRNSPTALEVPRSISRIIALQQVWARDFEMPGSPPRN